MSITRQTIKKLNVYTHPDLDMSEVDRKYAQKQVKVAVRMLDFRDTFCNEKRADIEKTALNLERNEPRLTSCKGSWGACFLLSPSINKRSREAAK